MVRQQGDSFREGLCLALQRMLISPNFLFRIERDQKPLTADTARPVSDYELASRLSYFLWSSTPDDELLRAGGGTKTAPARGVEGAGAAHVEGSEIRSRWWKISEANGCSSAAWNRTSPNARNSSNTRNTPGCRSRKRPNSFCNI